MSLFRPPVKLGLAAPPTVNVHHVPLSALLDDELNVRLGGILEQRHGQ
jgi:hypothetical protein